MNLKLVTLTGIKMDESVYSVTIPTVDGEISVFPVHEPMVTLARSGVIAVTYEKDGDAVEYFAISGGVVEVKRDGIQILVDEAEQSDEIVEAEVKAALDRAMKMHDEAGDQVEREKARQLVDRQAVRLKVAELKRRRKH